MTVIDLPQAVDALRHPRALDPFLRDVNHLCRYFTRQGVVRDPHALALDLWRRHVG